MSRNTNELCYEWETEYGYNAHMIGFSIMVYYKGKPWMQVETESALHELIKENINMKKKGGVYYG